MSSQKPGRRPDGFRKKKLLAVRINNGKLGVMTPYWKVRIDPILYGARVESIDAPDIEIHESEGVAHAEKRNMLFNCC